MRIDVGVWSGNGEREWRLERGYVGSFKLEQREWQSKQLIGPCHHPGTSEWRMAKGQWQWRMANGNKTWHRP